MIYRLYKPESDFEQVLELCAKNGVAFPERGLVFVAFDEVKKKIVAVIGIKTDVYIEPLVIENNPVAGARLFAMAEGVLLKEKISEVRCITDEKYEELFNKAGFNCIESRKIIMQKKY